MFLPNRNVCMPNNLFLRKLNISYLIQIPVPQNQNGRDANGLPLLFLKPLVTILSSPLLDWQWKYFYLLPSLPFDKKYVHDCHQSLHCENNDRLQPYAMARHIFAWLLLELAKYESS